MVASTTQAPPAPPVNRPGAGAHAWQWVILLAAIALWLRPIHRLLNGYWMSHTGWYDPMRALNVIEAWRGGLWDARWFPLFDWGYGYPFLSYYAPLFHWMSGLSTLLLDSASKGARFALGIMLVAGTVGVYLAANRFWAIVTQGRSHAWYPGLFAALAWLMSPYPMVNVYVRGALPEFASSQMLGWIFWAALGVLARGGRWHLRDVFEALLLALFVAMAVLFHNFFGMASLGFAVLTIPIGLAVRGLCGGLARGERADAARRALACAVAIAAAMLLTMFFWLPALQEREFVRTYTLLEGYFDYNRHFVHVGNLLHVHFWGWGLSDTGLNDWMPLHLGYVSLLGLASALAALAIGAAAPREGRLPAVGAVAILLAGTVAGVLLTMPATKFLWDRVELLQYGQFPWRLLSVPTFGIALLVPSALVLLPAERRVRAAGLATMAMYVAICFFFSNANYARIEGIMPALYNEDPSWWHTMQITTVETDDYGPIWRETARPPTVEPGSVTPDAPVTVRRADNRRGVAMQLDVLNESGAEAGLAIAWNYFPAWKATAGGGAALRVSPEDGTGFLRLDGIPPGESTVRVRFGNTPVRAWTKGVSLAAWLAWVVAVALVARMLLIRFHHTIMRAH